MNAGGPAETAADGCLGGGREARSDLNRRLSGYLIAEFHVALSPHSTTPLMASCFCSYYVRTMSWYRCGMGAEGTGQWNARGAAAR
jgi:hypothetical protein